MAATTSTLFLSKRTTIVFVETDDLVKFRISTERRCSILFVFVVKSILAREYQRTCRVYNEIAGAFRMHRFTQKFGINSIHINGGSGVIAKCVVVYYFVARPVSLSHASPPGQ